ncbi:MAG: transcriptional regulator [Spirochaetes bacterium GWB1_48_6]|nr:MAG: transcriptional regulator [Spirochaetes bacterium GWB1_48_6]
MKLTVLVVDDEKNIRDGLGRFLELEGYDVKTAEDGKAALDLLNKGHVDLILSDLKMPRLSGEELLKAISTASPNIPVIILTGHGTIENAVAAMRDGAYDFLTKPVNLDRLSMLVKRALSNRVLALEHQALKDEVEKMERKRKYSQLIGRSAPMQKVFDLISQVANTRASVLITGESGVGKELAADALHNLSDRNSGPFIKVHCAALTETLLESELFGHERGSFTGAIGQKKGRFELADGGTIFLDEIGEINPSVQVKLLRVLQERSFERVGGEKPVEVDVRLVAATNRDLKAEIAAGRFREDLFYRLNVVNITLPPLRERKDDIPLLAASFLAEVALENNKKIEGMDNKARMALYNYRWPGNVRELRNVIESSVVLCKGSIVTLEDLPPQVRTQDEGNYIRLDLGVNMEEAEREIIRQTLNFQKGNKSRTAEVLGIGRKTLHRKIQEYGLEEEFGGE